MKRKKSLALLLSLLLAAAIAGCGGNPTGKNPSEPGASSSPLIPPVDDWSQLPGEEDSSEVNSMGDEGSSDADSSVSDSVSSGQGNASRPVSSRPTASGSSSAAASSRPSSSSAAASKPEPAPGTLRTTYQPEFAKGFKVYYYHGGAKIIETKFSYATETGTDNTRSQRVLLLPEGAVRPAGVKWDFEIVGKIDSVVTLASSHAGHFANLDAIEVVKGTSLTAAKCYIPELKQAIEQGKTAVVGKSGDTKQFDAEQIAKLNPQVIFVGGMQADVTAAAKLEESGLHCIYIGDFAENDFMARAQWIELFGFLVGKEQAGQDFLKAAAKRANEVIAKVQKLENKPNVLWFNSSKAPWSVKTELDSVGDMLRALGAKQICPEAGGKNAVSVQSEQFLTYLDQADRIIYGNSLTYLSNWGDKTDITVYNGGGIDFSAAKAYKSGDVYVVGYDWAQDTANVGDIMESLAKALYPDAFKDVKNPGKIIEFKKPV